MAPEKRSLVQLPVVVRWELAEPGATVPGSSEPGTPTHFAVFVDRPPVAPGKALDSLADGDEVCETTPGCPDAEWFTTRGVFETTDTEVRLETLADRRPTGRETTEDPHQVTVVLLNGRRERVGEAAFQREFFVLRPLPR